MQRVADVAFLARQVRKLLSGFQGTVLLTVGGFLIGTTLFSAKVMCRSLPAWVGRDCLSTSLFTTARHTACFLNTLGTRSSTFLHLVVFLFSFILVASFFHFGASLVLVINLTDLFLLMLLVFTTKALSCCGFFDKMSNVGILCIHLGRVLARVLLLGR